MGMEMIDPGALAGATGADYKTGRRQGYANGSPQARRHHSAARLLRIVLTLSAHRPTPEAQMQAWGEFAAVIALRLDERERALMTYWVGRTLSPSVRGAVFDGAHWGAEP